MGKFEITPEMQEAYRMAIKVPLDWKHERNLAFALRDAVAAWLEAEHNVQFEADERLGHVDCPECGRSPRERQAEAHRRLMGQD